MFEHSTTRADTGVQDSWKGTEEVYTLEGHLKTPSQPDKFPKLDPQEWCLQPLELEQWRGFLFLRFEPGPQPSIAELMARHQTEFEAYPLENLQAVNG